MIERERLKLSKEFTACASRKLFLQIEPFDLVRAELGKLETALQLVEEIVMSEHQVEPRCASEDEQVTYSQCGNIYAAAKNCLPGSILHDGGACISRCYCPVCRLPEVLVR
jgi:hypothetical protein